MKEMEQITNWIQKSIYCVTSGMRNCPTIRNEIDTCSQEKETMIGIVAASTIETYYKLLPWNEEFV